VNQPFPVRRELVDEVAPDAGSAPQASPDTYGATSKFRRTVLRVLEELKTVALRTIESEDNPFADLKCLCFVSELHPPLQVEQKRLQRQLFADLIPEGLPGSPRVTDVARGLALFNPDLREFIHPEVLANRGRCRHPQS
jgi:hypothetical protein